jgi:hypothetical protein
LRSARARRVERVVVVSFVDVDELFMLLSVALLVEPFVPLLIPVELLVLPDDVPLFMVDERLVPVAVPLERVVLLLFIELPLFIDPLVVLLVPELGAVP